MKNVYKIDQNKSREFTLTIMDQASNRQCGALYFYSSDGAAWNYMSLVPVSSWDKKEFATALFRDEIKLLVPEYQQFLAQQLLREI